MKLPDALSRCPRARAAAVPADVHLVLRLPRRHAAGIPGPRASSPGELPSRLGGSPQRLPWRSPAPLAAPRAPPPLPSKGCPRSATPPMTPRKETSARSRTIGCARPPGRWALPRAAPHRILRNWVVRTCRTRMRTTLGFSTPHGSPQAAWHVTTPAAGSSRSSACSDLRPHPRRAL